MKTPLINLVLILSLLLSACNNNKSQQEDSTGKDIFNINSDQGTSLLGEKLISEQPDPEKDSVIISNYIKARKEYKENPEDADAIIWYGRRTAYLGDYKSAIDIYAEGIEKFPEDARMFRHRGHRYISNTPVSSLNTNIWYHLGLAHYLKGNMQEALDGFQQSLDASTNPDMYVAAANWVYMIQRRLGHLEEAEKILEPVSRDMDVFENMAYHNLLLFYKGVLNEDELKDDKQDVEYMNDATAYGTGNWYYYNGDTTRAKEILLKLLDHGNWASFGSLAAEADLHRLRREF